MTFVRTCHSRGHRYKQLCENRWDPVKKCSVTKVIRQLGTVIEEDGKEKFRPSSLKVDSVDKAYPVGKLAVFWKLAEEFKIQSSILKALENSDKEYSMPITLLVYNQLIGRKPLTKIGQWVSDTPIPRWTDIDVHSLTKDYFLSALDTISDKGGDVEQSYSYIIQNELTRSWKRVIGNEPERYFFFQDVTRIRWNGSPSYWAQRGYGKQPGRIHLGFGLIVSNNNYMPIMGYPVRGSKHDSTTIRETIDNLSRWKHKRITLVWDRGAVNKDNICIAREARYHVLSGVPMTSDEAKDMITKYSDSEIERWENILKLGRDKAVYYKDEIEELFGNECRVVVMLDPKRRNNSRIERDLILKALETETNRKHISKLKKDLNSFIRPSPGRKGYVIDTKEEALARNSDGRSLFFCTDKRMTGEQIIRTYFQKDYVEKAFRFLRGNACLTPVRYQLPGRVEAYLSVVNFIAYELIAGVLWKIKKHKLDISYDDLMEEAEKIYEVEMTSKNSKVYRWTHISKDIEKLFKPYNIIALRT